MYPELSKGVELLIMTVPSVYLVENDLSVVQKFLYKSTYRFEICGNGHLRLTVKLFYNDKYEIIFLVDNITFDVYDITFIDKNFYQCKII